jgi:type I restriction enzyme R subunit
MNKKDLSERDICTQYITPAVQQAGWDLRRQVREEASFTDGRIIVQERMRSLFHPYHAPRIPTKTSSTLTISTSSGKVLCS